MQWGGVWQSSYVRWKTSVKLSLRWFLANVAFIAKVQLKPVHSSPTIWSKLGAHHIESVCLKMPQWWPKARVTFADPCSLQFSSLPAKGLQHYFPEAFLSSFFATPCQVMLLLAECVSPFLPAGWCHYVPVPPSLAWKLVHLSVEGGKIRRFCPPTCITKGILMCKKRHLKESRGK